MPDKNSKRETIDLGGGYSPDEIRELRRLGRSLAADGYEVAKVALAAGGRPAALVFAGRASDPFRLMITAARTFLRAVETLEVGRDRLVISAADFETLATLRVTARTATAFVVPEESVETVGEVAHVDFARAAIRGDIDES